MFSKGLDGDRGEVNMCALILEPLLNSNIDSITDLDLYNNLWWFKQPNQGDHIDSNIVLLAELITK